MADVFYVKGKKIVDEHGYYSDRCHVPDCMHQRSTFAVNERWPFWNRPYNCPFGRFPEQCAEYAELVERHREKGELKPWPPKK